jgi:hypothetical protein
MVRQKIIEKPHLFTVCHSTRNNSKRSPRRYTDYHRSSP